MQNQATDAPQQISSVTLYKNGSTQVDQIALFSTSPANKSGAIPIVITASDNNFRVELRVSVDGDNATSGSTTASIPLVLSYGSTNVIVTNPATDPTVSVFPNGVNESCA